MNWFPLLCSPSSFLSPALVHWEVVSDHSSDIKVFHFITHGTILLTRGNFHSKLCSTWKITSHLLVSLSELLIAYFITILKVMSIILHQSIIQNLKLFFLSKIITIWLNLLRRHLHIDMKDFSPLASLLMMHITKWMQSSEHDLKTRFLFTCVPFIFEEMEKSHLDKCT